jgi:hypothetical protein
MPWNLFALAFTDYDRSDILADRFESVLFGEKGKAQTFADLKPQRPRLLINATDLQSGKPFVFCDEAFDELNSDLSKYPISHAVAASAAVPVLLHQVTLRDFSTIFEQYRHLIDGSINEQPGGQDAGGCVSAAASRGAGGSVSQRGDLFGNRCADGVFRRRFRRQGDTTLADSLRFTAGLASTALINRASSATLAEIILESSPDNVPAGTLRSERDELINNGYVRFDNIDGRPVHVVHIAHVAGAGAEGAAERGFFRVGEQHRDVLQHRAEPGLPALPGGGIAGAAEVQTAAWADFRRTRRQTHGHRSFGFRLTSPVLIISDTCIFKPKRG